MVKPAPKLTIINQNIFKKLENGNTTIEKYTFNKYNSTLKHHQEKFFVQCLQEIPEPSAHHTGMLDSILTNFAEIYSRPAEDYEKFASVASEMTELARSVVLNDPRGLL